MRRLLFVALILLIFIASVGAVEVVFVTDFPSGLKEAIEKAVVKNMRGRIEGRVMLSDYTFDDDSFAGKRLISFLITLDDNSLRVDAVGEIGRDLEKATEREIERALFYSSLVVGDLFGSGEGENREESMPIEASNEKIPEEPSDNSPPPPEDTERVSSGTLPSTDETEGAANDNSADESFTTSNDSEASFEDTTPLSDLGEETLDGANYESISTPSDEIEDASQEEENTESEAPEDTTSKEENSEEPLPNSAESTLPAEGEKEESGPMRLRYIFKGNFSFESKEYFREGENLRLYDLDGRTRGLFEVSGRYGDTYTLMPIYLKDARPGLSLEKTMAWRWTVTFATDIYLSNLEGSIELGNTSWIYPFVPKVAFVFNMRGGIPFFYGGVGLEASFSLYEVFRNSFTLIEDGRIGATAYLLLGYGKGEFSYGGLVSLYYEHYPLSYLSWRFGYAIMPTSDGALVNAIYAGIGGTF